MWTVPKQNAPRDGVNVICGTTGTDICAVYASSVPNGGAAGTRLVDVITLSGDLDGFTRG